MKKIIPLLLLLSILLFSALVFLLVFPKEDKEKEVVVSPIPDFLSIINNKQVSSLSLWLPALSDFISGKDSIPEITAKSVLIFDMENKKVLFEKNPKERLPMASLTKIMTAIIALENPKKDNRYLVREEDLVGENSMGLTSGETLSLEELLYGLILPSGNDAAEVLANNYQDGRAAFILAMNNKSKALGIKDTNFTNPSGLEGDGEQYSSPYDLMVMTHYALTNFPLFVKVVATYEKQIEQTNTHKGFTLYNETNLITSYPGVKGVKTGYTPEAGFCLVTYLDYKGNKIIGVILGSENRRQEMKDLLDYSLNLINVNPPPHI